jgi:hypothetical protein
VPAIIEKVPAYVPTPPPAGNVREFLIVRNSYLARNAVIIRDEVHM